MLSQSLRLWLRRRASKTQTPSNPQLRKRFRPVVETLEGRLAPATYTVTSPGDSGASTLRAEVDAANLAGGTNTIIFAPSAGQTITLTANDTNHPFAFGPTELVITSNLTIAGDPSVAGITIITTAEDRCRGILVGLAAGDQIGGPIRMAVRLAESLVVCGGFNRFDILERYLVWWREGAFDTGPVSDRAFALLASGMPAREATAQVHREFGGKSGS